MSIIDFYAVFFEGKFSCTLFHQERRTAISRSKVRPRIHQTGTTWRPAFLPGTRLKGCPPASAAESLSACTVFTAQGHRRSPAWRRILFRWHHSFHGQGPRHIVSSAARPFASQCRRAMLHNPETSKKFFQGLVPHQQLPPAQQAG